MKKFFKKFFWFIKPETKGDIEFVIIVTAMLAMGIILYKFKYPKAMPEDIICLGLVVGAFLFIYFVNRKKQPQSA